MSLTELLIKLYLLFCLYVFAFGVFTAWEDYCIDPEAAKPGFTIANFFGLLLFSLVPPFNLATLAVTIIYRQGGKR